MQTRKKNITILAFISCVCIISVFVLQSNSTNFRRGHRGWVTSHGLAIADKASASNNFVGYTCHSHKHPHLYFYFDRYPVFFSAISHFLLQTRSLPGGKVLLARHLCNVIYIAIFLIAFLLSHRFLSDPTLSLSLVLLLASGTRFVEYKDMFHFDWPALFGMMTFLLFLKLFEEKKVKPWTVVTAASLGCLMGRGYATCSAVLLWFLIEFKFNFPKFKKLKTPFLCLTSVCLWSTFALFYNIKNESWKTGAPLQETGIVLSAKKRTGLNDGLKVPWIKFIARLTRQTITGIIPFAVAVKVEKFNKKEILGKFFFLSCLLTIIFLIIRGVRKNFKNLKKIFSKYHNRTSLVIAFSGFFWLFPMKRLAFYHNYTNMYILGFYLILGVFFFSFIKTKYSKIIILATSFLLFIGSLYFVKKKYDLEENGQPNYTADFDIIRSILDQRNITAVNTDRIAHESRKRGTPYAYCFYLGERFSSQTRRWLIDPRLSLEGYINLTPQNKYYYLLEKR